MEEIGIVIEKEKVNVFNFHSYVNTCQGELAISFRNVITVFSMNICKQILGLDKRDSKTFMHEMPRVRLCILTECCTGVYEHENQ